jgi:hypothetical protein
MVDIVIPELPNISTESTTVYQAIFQIGKDPLKIVDPKSRKYGEFIRVVSNYPVYFDHYYSHARYRLSEIHNKYGKMADYYDKRYKTGHLVKHVNPEIVYEVYWDFESYLTTMSTSLDILTIMCRPAFKQETPSTFTQFCKWIPKNENPNEPYLILKSARDEWASKMKAYRVQAVHYTPLNKDASLVSLNELGERFEFLIRLPDPDSIPEKDLLKEKAWYFTYNNNIDLLKYSIDVFNKLTTLEKTIASEFLKLYENGEYPKKER